MSAAKYAAPNDRAISVDVCNKHYDGNVSPKKMSNVNVSTAAISFSPTGLTAPQPDAGSTGCFCHPS